MLQEIYKSVDKAPPDIEFLVRALSYPDWFVAAVAAEQIGLLQQSQQLTEEQEVIVIQALIEGLGSSGHWWRFGWDRDEAEFEQFRSTAIAAVSAFGPRTFSKLLTASYSRSAYKRKATCWIVLEMIKSEGICREDLIEQGMLDRISTLAQGDMDADVRQICGYVYDTISDK